MNGKEHWPNETIQEAIRGLEKRCVAIEKALIILLTDGEQTGGDLEGIVRGLILSLEAEKNGNGEL
jgi:hypothetical protein